MSVAQCPRAGVEKGRISLTKFFLWSVHLLGALATALVFIFVSIRAFGGPVVYNDGVAALIVVAATWVVTNTMIGKIHD
jgi:hypothetical protein